MVVFLRDFCQRIGLFDGNESRKQMGNIAHRHPVDNGTADAEMRRQGRVLRYEGWLDDGGRR